MQRSAQHATSGSARAPDARAMAAVRQTVVPLLELTNAATQALSLGRMARAIELRERAVAAAEASLPSDSLTLASLLHSAAYARMEATNDARGTCVVPLHERASVSQSPE
jgi:hypothetical protein